MQVLQFNLMLEEMKMKLYLPHGVFRRLASVMEKCISLE